MGCWHAHFSVGWGGDAGLAEFSVTDLPFEGLTRVITATLRGVGEVKEGLDQGGEF